MRAKMKSRRSVASPRIKSSSTIARSKTIAKSKSGKSSEKVLRVATPKNTKLSLPERGLVVPLEITAQEDVVPLDFTRLTSRQLGKLHSTYATRYAHAIYVVAKYSSSVVAAERDFKLLKARKRVLLGGKYRTKYKLDDAVSVQDDVREIEDEIARLEASVKMTEAVAQGYDVIAKAASREMFRRSSERGTD